MLIIAAILQYFSKGPCRSVVFKNEIDLRAWNLLPRGLWGPTGLLLARDLWALDPAGVRGPGTEAWLWGGEIPDVLSLGL